MGTTSENFDKSVYAAAREFLLPRIPHDQRETILAQYLDPAENASETSATLRAIYQRALDSAQNVGMSPKVIGGAIGGVEKLGPVLFGFEPRQVIAKFDGDANALLDAIVDQLQPRGEIRRVKKGLWPRYCVTILSAARFFGQFQDGAEFLDWARHFYEDQRTRAALPLILSEEIEGIGYALACDFLKELGFRDYGKPDVHIMTIFKELRLCERGARPYQIQKAITRIAGNVGVSPNHVDKLFWLIGSGNFYKHPNLGDAGKIGGNRKAFIRDFQTKHQSA